MSEKQVRDTVIDVTPLITRHFQDAAGLILMAKGRKRAGKHTIVIQVDVTESGTYVMQWDEVPGPGGGEAEMRLTPREVIQLERALDESSRVVTDGSE